MSTQIPRNMSMQWVDKPVPKNITAPDVYKAARGFEAYFVRYLMKEIEGSMSMVGGKGYGGDFYQKMYTDVLGEEIANKGSLGIGEMIYRQMMIGRGDEPYQEIEKSSSNMPRKFEPYEDIIREASEKYKINPEIIISVIEQESNADKKVVSSKGAKGLMQLIDSTAAEMGVSDSFNPRQNIMGGTKYLRQQLDSFGDLDLALAAYNAGPGAVRKYHGIPPYKETQNYVKKINERIEKYKDIFVGKVNSDQKELIRKMVDQYQISQIKGSNVDSRE
jgi:Rod binding domain-containing protein